MVHQLRACLIGIGFVVLTLLLVPAAAAQPADETRDQYQPICFDCGNHGYSIGIDQTIGQVFTAGLTGRLTMIDLAVMGLADCGTLSIEIRSVNAATGVPTDTVLATTQLSYADVPPFPGVPRTYEELVTGIRFLSPPTVVAGTPYAIILASRDTPPATWCYAVSFAAGDVYAGGHVLLHAGAGPFSVDAQSDLAFATYVTPADAVRHVTVDIRPSSAENRVNLTSGGVIAVAVLSSDGFDATTVLPETICFGDAEDASQRDCTEAHGKRHIQDANDDGVLDLVLHFETQQTGIDPGDTRACLTGQTGTGGVIEGCDIVSVR